MVLLSENLSICDGPPASVLVARAAMWNPSIFREDGPLPLDQVIPAFLKLAIQYCATEKNVKYILQRMLQVGPDFASEATES